MVWTREDRCKPRLLLSQSFYTVEFVFVSVLQVVKAFIVLNPPFQSHDQDQLIKELQQHVKSVTAPYKYPRKVSMGG